MPPSESDPAEDLVTDETRAAEDDEASAEMDEIGANVKGEDETGG